MHGPTAAAIRAALAPAAHHGGDHAFHDAIQRTFPAGMGSAHDTGLGITKENGRTVGGGDGEDQAAFGGDQGVGSGASSGAHGLSTRTVVMPWTWRATTRSCPFKASATIRRLARTFSRASPVRSAMFRLS